MQEMIDCLIEEANRCRGLAKLPGAEMFRDAYLHKAELFEQAADVLRKVNSIKPHGRLIDADALRENWFLTNDTGTQVVEVCEIDAAPTIIPAEGQP